MKKLFLVCLLLVAGSVIAQENTSRVMVEEVGATSKYTWFHANGSVKEIGYFVNGEKHGVWTSYDEAGNKIMEGNYVHGIKDGNWKIYQKDGSLQFHLVYENGNRIITTEWDSNGNVVAGVVNKN